MNTRTFESFFYLLDEASQHRGDKLRHRFVLLNVIILLSLAYLLSIDLLPFLSYNRVTITCFFSTCSECLPFSQVSSLYYGSTFSTFAYTPILFRRRQPQSNQLSDIFTFVFSLPPITYGLSSFIYLHLPSLLLFYFHLPLPDFSQGA